MKKMLTVSNGERFAAHILKTTLVLLIGLAFGTAFWVASMPSAQAQDMSPTKMIESQLQGKTSTSASKQEYLAAVCEAVKKFRSASPQVVRAAVEAHPNWKKDVLRATFRCAGSDDCKLLNRILRGAIAGGGGSDASELTELAIELAPNCAGSFGSGGGGGGDEEGNFGNPPGNQNPPPGSIGGGGGQGNVIAVCFNGVTQFLSPEAAADFLNSHPGATLGACVVTQFQNN
jgi:hypothetical protein